MTQNEALFILETGANVFLTGEPGSGKTHTINRFVSYLRERKVEPAITASTGIAATHIGGMTIHSWSGIGIKENLTKYDLDKITSSEYLNKRIQKTKVLIIDEISMLRADTLSMVDAVCREVKQNPEPFGGMQVILVGDFFQLPPIYNERNKTAEQNIQNSLLEENEDMNGKVRFAFESTAWKRLNPVMCYLTEQHRQDDVDFLSVLSAIRSGNVKDTHIEHINSRLHTKNSADISLKLIENIPKLFSRNINVDQMNGEMLGKIEGDSKYFTMNFEGKDILVSILKKGCLSPENLELKKGSVVMCTKNNPKDRFVNGTLGKVVDFADLTGYPIIKIENGRNIVVAPMDWSLEENGKIKAKITQIPLRLAWAITVHKSQGMSMDAAVMDLSDVFEYGQGYVALSRVRRLSGLHILGINDRALQVHPEILEKDNEFRRASENAREVFGKVSKEDAEKMRKNFIVASGGKWKEEKNIKNPTPTLPKGLPAVAGDGKSESKEKHTEGNPPYVVNRLEKIREKHQNAYKKWNTEEEEKITLAFQNGKSVKEIAKETGRQNGGIRSRLIKLGLIEE